jgi:hypothetical protein
MAEQNLSVDIKIKADTTGAKQATAAIDGVDKAVADLSKTEKEATNINGMYLDSLGRIHDESGRFVKVAAEDRAGLKERIKLQQQDTVTTTGAVQAKKELGKANSGAAMGFMALSNGLQDVQYGLGGIVNNIPGIVTGMGLGMGVAGAVQIAAVGVQFLTKNLSLFTGGASEAAKEADKTAQESVILAGATNRAADSAENAAQKQKDLADALARTEARYKANTKAADEAVEAAKRFQDIETKRADLQSDLAMAEIDAMVAGGTISKDEASARRDGVRAQRAARAAQLEEQTLARTIEAEKEKAKAAEEAAKSQQNILKTTLSDDRAIGLLTKGRRKAAEDLLKAAEDEAAAAKQRFTDEENTNDTQGMINDANFILMGDVYRGSKEEAQRVKRIEQEKANYQKQLNEATRIRAQLAADAAARESTGMESLDQFQARQSAVSKQMTAFESQSAEARSRSAVAGGNLGLARETTAVRARIAAITQTSAAAAAAQSGYGIGFTGPVPPQGFDVDQKEAAKAAKEAESANRSNTAATIKIIRALAGELKLTKEQLLALNGVVEDIRSTK